MNVDNVVLICQKPTSMSDVIISFNINPNGPRLPLSTSLRAHLNALFTYSVPFLEGSYTDRPLYSISSPPSSLCQTSNRPSTIFDIHRFLSPSPLGNGKTLGFYQAPLHLSPNSPQNPPHPNHPPPPPPPVGGVVSDVRL